MNRLPALISLLSVVTLVAAQEQPNRYWIEFRDKGSQALQGRSPRELGISDRAMHRRAKVLPADRLIDELDIPVAAEYKAALRSLGAALHSESRWLNAVSATITPAQLTVAQTTLPIRTCFVLPTVSRREAPTTKPGATRLMKQTSTLPFSYGPSSYQVVPMSVPEVHALGINGSGVWVGMNDDGFNNLRTHASLKSVHIVGQYDFVQRDSSVERAAGEYDDQGFHGTATLSVLGGFDDGKLVGPAFGASYLLAKTEIDSSETLKELDYYIEGLEWMERQGADIVSTSLGYDDFNTPGTIARQPNGLYDAGDIVYKMKNGRTASVSIAATIAARKGVLVVTAMGNEHWERRDSFSVRPDSIIWKAFPGLTGSIVTPADADSILATGATYSFGEIAVFSSTGPTADGRIKPDVVAPGVGIVAAVHNTTNTYYGIQWGLTQGTSFSTPLTAGAAALVLSAHPELTPMQVREALMNTATHPIDSDPTHTSTWPNNFYGWGMVNALEAVLYHGIAAATRPMVTATDSFYIVTTWMRSKSALIPDSLQLFYRPSSGGAFTRARLQPTGVANEFAARIPKAQMGVQYVGFITARDASGKSVRIPAGAFDTTLSLAPTADSVRRYYPPVTVLGVPQSYQLRPNYPNPFNNTTAILFDMPAQGQVEIAVFNILGQRIRTILNGVAPQGINSASWDGRNESGMPVGSGIYLLRLTAPEHVFTGKMVLLR